MSEVADAYRSVQSRIDALCQSSGRSPDAVTLVAVSKRQPDEKVLAAYAAGARDFGENYIQAMLERRDRLGGDMPDARWHFIGRVQTNKAKLIAQCDVVHGAGAERHVDALVGAGFAGDLFLQVDVVGEAQKNGVSIDEVPALWARRSPSLVGLMTMGAAGADARPTYEALAALAARLGVGDDKKPYLSMGMSADFDVAVQSGATHVRVGSAIFGARD